MFTEVPIFQETSSALKYACFRSSRLGVLYKIDVVKKFAKFTGKHLRQIPFFNKVAGVRPVTLLKKRLAQVFSCEFCTFFTLLAASLVSVPALQLPKLGESTDEDVRRIFAKSVILKISQN